MKTYLLSNQLLLLVITSITLHHHVVIGGIQTKKWNLWKNRRKIHHHVTHNNHNSSSHKNIQQILQVCYGGSSSSSSSSSSINNVETIDDTNDTNDDQNQNFENNDVTKNSIIPTSIPPIDTNDNTNEEEQWRLNLPLQLQKRLGSLHKILIHVNVPIECTSSEDEKRIITTATTCCCELYLLGTAHVSKDSSQDAKLLMEAIKPDVLFVELCHQRLAILEDNDDDNNNNKKNQESNNNDYNNNNNNNNNDGNMSINHEKEEKKSIAQMTKEIMDHNPGMSRSAALSSVLLSKIQGDYASKLGVHIGGEFKEAFKVAKIQQKEYIQCLQRIQWQQQTGVWTPNEHDASLHGCAVVLGDRPVRLTLLRTWESLSLFGKVKLFFALLVSSLKQPNEKELKEWIESIMNDPTNDILSKSIEELSRHFPTVKKTIIAERDTYMACKILQTAQILGEATKQDGKVRKIVAIVGAGHCPGIRKGLDDESNNIENIETTLQSVIETKKHKVHGCPDMTSIVTDIASIDIL